MCMASTRITYVITAGEMLRVVFAAFDREHVRLAGSGADACLVQVQELFNRLVLTLAMIMRGLLIGMSC